MFHTLFKLHMPANSRGDFWQLIIRIQFFRVPIITSKNCTIVFAKRPKGGPKPSGVEHRVRTWGCKDSYPIQTPETTGGIDLRAYATETATRSKGRRIEMFFLKKQCGRELTADGVDARIEDVQDFSSMV